MTKNKILFDKLDINIELIIIFIFGGSLGSIPIIEYFLLIYHCNDIIYYL